VNVLVDIFANFQGVEGKVRRIKEIEHRGDDMTHEMLTKLNQTFITPFDREDIHRLTSSIDDVLDFINSASERLVGIVAGALYTAGIMTKSDLAEDWGRYHWPIILAAHFAISLGTYLGGWRIVHTMGSRITKLKPVGGFCAETAGAITLFATALAGIPVSTTHTITGAIVGVGSVNRLSAVRWGVAGRIVWAWILTIPASAGVASGVFLIIRFFYAKA
jgi:Phosphate transporter family/Protein of unknown function DUF47